MIPMHENIVDFERGDPGRQVAVIVPLYNYAGTIVQALDSVAAQTCHDIVIVVTDDASTDASFATARKWMNRYDGPMSLRLIANITNAGLSATRNVGIARSTSPYCFFLDADNVLYPRCIARHLAALNQRPDCAGAYSIIEEFGGTAGLIGNNVFARGRLSKGNYIDAMAMVRRSALETLGGFRPIKHGWEDFDLWLRLCHEGEQLLHIPEILSRYRNHNQSMLRQQTNRKDNILELCALMRDLHPWLELEDPQFA